jgi:hypothetical protein
MEDITPSELRAAFYWLGMARMDREQLVAVITEHEDKPEFASRVICAAARQALVMAAQRGG